MIWHKQFFSSLWTSSPNKSMLLKWKFVSTVNILWKLRLWESVCVWERERVTNKYFVLYRVRNQQSHRTFSTNEKTWQSDLDHPLILALRYMFTLVIIILPHLCALHHLGPHHTNHHHLVAHHTSHHPGLRIDSNRFGIVVTIVIFGRIIILILGHVVAIIILLGRIMTIISHPFVLLTLSFPTSPV